MQTSLVLVPHTILNYALLQGPSTAYGRYSVLV